MESIRLHKKKCNNCDRIFHCGGACKRDNTINIFTSCWCPTCASRRGASLRHPMDKCPRVFTKQDLLILTVKEL